jgi:chromate transporter
VTVAAVGAIAGATLVLARRQFTDIPSPLIALVVVLLLIQFKKVRELFIIIAAALIGLIIKKML